MFLAVDLLGHFGFAAGVTDSFDGFLFMLWFVVVSFCTLDSAVSFSLSECGTS